MSLSLGQQLSPDPQRKASYAASWGYFVSTGVFSGSRRDSQAAVSTQPGKGASPATPAPVPHPRQLCAHKQPLLLLQRRAPSSDAGAILARVLPTAPRAPTGGVSRQLPGRLTTTSEGSWRPPGPPTPSRMAPLEGGGSTEHGSGNEAPTTAHAGRVETRPEPRPLSAAPAAEGQVCGDAPYFSHLLA